MKAFNRNKPLVLGGTLVATLGLLLPCSARAHDVLNFPPPWVVEDALGDPQKVAPCGVDSTVNYTPSNIVTTFAPGQTITVRWQETIAHDGWFRIALSYKDRTDLKIRPTRQMCWATRRTPGSRCLPCHPCWSMGSTHTPPRASRHRRRTRTSSGCRRLHAPGARCSWFSSSNHHPYNMPGGYFYHHCADISIQLGADGGAETVELDAGEGSSSSGGNGATSSSGGSGSSGAAAASTSGASSGGGSTAAGGNADEAGAGETSGSGAPAQSVAQGSSGGGCSNLRWTGHGRDRKRKPPRCRGPVHTPSSPRGVIAQRSRFPTALQSVFRYSSSELRSSAVRASPYVWPLFESPGWLASWLSPFEGVSRQPTWSRS